MVLTGKRRLGSDIWLKTSDQAKSIENMIKIVWYKETYYWQKANRT